MQKSKLNRNMGTNMSHICVTFCQYIYFPNLNAETNHSQVTKSRKDLFINLVFIIHMCEEFVCVNFPVQLKDRKFHTNEFLTHMSNQYCTNMLHICETFDRYLYIPTLNAETNSSHVTKCRKRFV